MKHTTTRRHIPIRGNLQYEALPAFGWRCGFYSLHPAGDRHQTHPEFLSGLRRGRAQRQSDSLPPTAKLILGMPHLVAMRRAVQSAYSDAAYRDKVVASALRAAGRNDGRISSAGRDIGAVWRERAQADAIGIWDDWHRLSAAYEAERGRLFALRGVSE